MWLSRARSGNCSTNPDLLPDKKKLQTRRQPGRKIKHLGLPRIFRGRSQSFGDQGHALYHNFQLFFLNFPVRKPPTRLNDSCSAFDESWSSILSCVGTWYLCCEHERT